MITTPFEPGLEQHSKTESVPLPLGAQLIWRQNKTLAEMGYPKEAMVITWQLDGKLDESHLLNAINTAVARLDIFRLHLKDHNGQGHIEKVPFEKVVLELVDEEELRATLERWASRDIPLGSPSCSCRFFRLSESKHLLGLSGGHELLDLHTFHQILHNIADEYNQEREEDKKQPTYENNFYEFSQWHQSMLKTGQLNESQSYWQQLLEKTEPVFAQAPAPDPSLPACALVKTTVPFPLQLQTAVSDIASQNGITIFETYLAAFYVLLQQITERDRVLTAFVASLRRQPEFKNIAGCMVNRFYLPITIQQTDSLYDIAKKIHTTMHEGKQHLLWPTHQRIDPTGVGYPGVFFHYVPLLEIDTSLFKKAYLHPFQLCPLQYWPLPLTLQVIEGKKSPVILCMGQAQFCTSQWLDSFAQQYVTLLQKISIT